MITYRDNYKLFTKNVDTWADLCYAVYTNNYFMQVLTIPLFYGRNKYLADYRMVTLREFWNLVAIVIPDFSRRTRFCGYVSVWLIKIFSCWQERDIVHQVKFCAIAELHAILEGKTCKNGPATTQWKIMQ